MAGAFGGEQITFPAVAPSIRPERQVGEECCWSVAGRIGFSGRDQSDLSEPGGVRHPGGQHRCDRAASVGLEDLGVGVDDRAFVASKILDGFEGFSAPLTSSIRVDPHNFRSSR